ncbi:hypothetical protein [Shinella sp.]|uniref:hypothetical protein n=1 Tax=Shinella sp. TaxID=1870904 RepID=UPI003F709A30
MTVALYADYIAELKSLFAELDRYPERFQTYTARFELAAAGNLVVYETRRRKGQTDSLYYGRSGATGANQQISQATAFAAIDRFFALGEFVALTGEAGARVEADTQYPHCAVNFSYRKKGQPVTRSTLMVFVAFNDEADALQYVSQAGDPSAFVIERPWRAEKSYEWK